jgi:rare lipoprotein A (peptidoglycan hydrolase)
VIDRGPYVKGRAWDLTAAASEALGFEEVGVGRVGYQVAVEYARP